MVKLIMGLSGSGKTKTLLSLVHQALETEHGNVVCVERSKSLTYDIPYQVRLIPADEYGINTNELLRGFLLGLHAGNYDITHVFIDGFYKLLSDRSDAAVEQFLGWMEAFGDKEGIQFTLTASADPARVSDAIRKYF